MARWLKAVNGVIIDVDIGDTKPEDIGDIKYYAQIPNVGIGWEYCDSSTPCWRNRNTENLSLSGVVLSADLEGTPVEVNPMPELSE